MEYRCLLCGDVKFSNRYGVVRHLEEKHSGFRWECQQCTKLFPRQASGAHNDADGKVCKSSFFVCVSPDAGSRGSAARIQLDHWWQMALPGFWKAVPVVAKVQRKQRPSRKDSPPHQKVKLESPRRNTLPSSSVF
ncbi:uncharacterized protein LOC117325340 [Pecten maximus]|uniref:uncharacterized protein LOC117325340 n=1 Tax=Pecten maximus TaxID=6579 RepID=UPI0014585A70|nr:uncharacterized protein LOC117325340 [Pecten maximus]